MRRFKHKETGEVWEVVGIGSRGYRLKSDSAITSVSQEDIDREFIDVSILRDVSAPVEFQVGDVVILKSGGLQMTVCYIDSHCVRAVWMDQAGDIRERQFFRELLTRVDDQQLQPVPLS